MRIIRANRPAIQEIIKYLHELSLNTCIFSKDPLGSAKTTLKPSFPKPFNISSFLSLHLLFLWICLNHAHIEDCKQWRSRDCAHGWARISHDLHPGYRTTFLNYGLFTLKQLIEDCNYVNPCKAYFSNRPFSLEKQSKGRFLLKSVCHIETGLTWAVWTHSSSWIPSVVRLFTAPHQCFLIPHASVGRVSP